MGLPAAYAQVSFAEPARARANLELLAGQLPESLWALLPTLLAQVPDPDGALNRLERFAREAGRRVLDALVREPVLLHYLLALFAHSGFLSETLIQQPEMVLWLGREKNLERLKSREELLEEYARFESTAPVVEPGLALARFKRRQYLRITLRDILGLATLVETTLELSTLADVLLEKALARVETELRARYGAPQTQDARGRLVPARFAVVSLGKLGGHELNYSSDIDLLFLFEGEGETSASEASQRLANSEFFIRLAQRLLQIIAGVTREGPVFRVDLRLRPGGGEGDVALSLPAALNYYQRRAREWELQMLLKARHSAGKAALVREFLTAVEPHLYRGAMHFAAVESVLKAREEIDRKLDAAGHERVNVKLAPGGIRDIEFLVQCLQRLHGQQDPWVRAVATLVGLQKLFDKGYLAARDHFRLAAAYQFLRRVEHRLQLEHGEQIHTLPESSEAVTLLARRCGVAARAGLAPAEEFRTSLDEHLRQVQAISERVLPRAGRAGEREEFSLRPPEGMPLAGDLSYEELLERLRAMGSPLSSQLERLELGAPAQRALRRFLAAAVGSSSVFEAVSRAAGGLPAAVDILRLSEPLGALLQRHPDRLADLLDLSGAPPAPEEQLEIELAAGFAAGVPPALAAAVQPGQSLAQQMAGLRSFFAGAVFRWGAREVCQRAPVERGLRAYTRLAEDVLRASLRVAEQHAGPRGREEAGFAVIALGRLGTAEMDLGSDADLVFVIAEPARQAEARPIAEKFLHVVSGYTREGTIFPVDVRLRPRGREGELVQTAEYVLDYFASSAEVWEAVTYLKARPVAGDLKFGEEVCQEVRSLLARRFSDGEKVRESLAEMRKRLEEECRKSPEGADNFKSGPGGFYDLDFLVSALALRAGATSLAARPLSEQVELVGRGGSFASEEGEQLREAARMLRAVDHAIRLATGRGSSQLPRGPRAEAVAELASGCLGEELPVASLAARLEETRRAVRAHFRRVFG